MNILCTALLLSAIVPNNGLLPSKQTSGLLPNKQTSGLTLGGNYSPRPTRTRLFANLWERMDIEEDEEPMWYLINCVAGLELDLLRQCLQRTEDMDDVEKIVVPMMRSTRSHGARRMVTDVKVKYQGYVFAKLKLTEKTYLAIQGLDLCRSWMGTVNQRGYRKLPPAPLPLNEDEIENFGLEDIEQLNEDDSAEDDIIVDSEENDDKEAKEIEEVVKNVYLDLRVEDMIKVTAKNKFFDEDGIVRRLKDGKIFVRFYTYGTMYEEWLDPSDVRKLTEEEVMRGLGGPSQPITQRDIDGPNHRYQNDYGESRDGARRNAYDSLGGGGQRNRRQDRNERRFSRGDSLQDQQRERNNWDWYKDNERKQRSGAYGDGKYDIRGSNPEGDVGSQWGRGPQMQRKRDNSKRDSRNSKQSDSGDDWSSFVSNAPTPQKKQDTDDFFDSLYNDLSNELEIDGSGAQSNNGEDEDFFSMLTEEINGGKPSKSSSVPAKKNDEDDFFASLEMELQNDASKQSSNPSDDLDDFFAELGDFGDAAKPAPAPNGGGDDFFASLESELETELLSKKPAKAASKPGTANDFFADLEVELAAGMESTPVSKTGDSDDFFASLESELETELVASKKPAKAAFKNPAKFASKRNTANDFFADLEAELEAGMESTPVSKAGDSDDFFASLESELETELVPSKKPAKAAFKKPVKFASKPDTTNDFFADLEAELEAGMESTPVSKTRDKGDFFASLESELETGFAAPKKPAKVASKKPVKFASKPDTANDFFANLEAELEAGMESTPVSNDGDSDDFFASLESELETELVASKKPAKVAPKKPAKFASKPDTANDFFADLEAELEAELESTPVSNGGDSDDFFASLESELQAELASDKPAKASKPDTANDFFANLETELEDGIASTPASNAGDTDASLEQELSNNDFFSELEDVVEEAEKEVVAPTKAKIEAPAPSAKIEAPVPSSNGSNLDPTSLQKCTVPALKEMLRERGLKVGGRKAELIERLAA